ncbi:MAG: IS21 family transposase [Gammaproteobacteria bacterium]|nr:IS21 family transposase [Gammaproteobacteria bacterium]
MRRGFMMLTTVHDLTWPPDEVRLLPLERLDERLHRYRLTQPKLEQSMARSLERYGQISPIVICLHDGEQVLIDGFKRLGAARTLKGLTHLTARRLEVDEQGAKAAIYNLNRLGQRPLELEESWIVQALVREDGLSQVEAAQLLGRHKSWVNRRLAVLERLCDAAREELRLGLLTPALARQLTRLPRAPGRRLADGPRGLADIAGAVRRGRLVVGQQHARTNGVRVEGAAPRTDASPGSLRASLGSSAERGRQPRGQTLGPVAGWPGQDAHLVPLPGTRRVTSLRPRAAGKRLSAVGRRSAYGVGAEPRLRSGAEAAMSQETDNEIVSRRQSGQSLRGIARDLNVSRWRVTRVVRQQQTQREDLAAGPIHAELPAPRSSMLDAFEPRILQLLERYPKITATRMLEELQAAGYQGSYTILRHRVKALRPRPQKPLVVRFETAPGAQAQVDWSTYEIDFTHEGPRRVNLFSYLLGYSRRQYLCFTERQDFETTIRQHILAFHHLGGVATTCLYDNMKTVVTRWEDEQPLYNTRFLSFATHYGYRPQACRPRRPQTKGKVEKAFFYVETNLLNGRTFRSLEHLNEVTRCWLAQVADVRTHRTTNRRPLDAHAEELPHLLQLPQRDYDTAQVVYRVVDAEGLIRYAGNHYSVPWQWVGEVLPVRITETELFIYDRQIHELARHPLLTEPTTGSTTEPTGRKQIDPKHRPPKNHAQQLEQLRQRFAELGTIASRFLAGLLEKQRCGKHQALRVLVLVQAYHRQDVLTAMERAVRYHAYSLSSLERILSVQATPKASWQLISEQQQELLRKLSEGDSIEARHSEQYQYLLFQEHEPSDTPQAEQQQAEQQKAEQQPPEQQPDAPRADPKAPGDAQDSAEG